VNNISANNASSVNLRTVFQVCLRLVLVLLSFALAAGVATVLRMPKQYFSKVTMQVQPDASTGRAAPPVDSLQSYAPQYLQPQMAVLQTTKVLYPVIERLELTNAYAPPGTTVSPMDAYQRLRAAMRVRESRNTGLIEIGISDTDPQRAANVANAIAIIYQDQRRSAEVDRAWPDLVSLRVELETQRKKAEEASRSAAEIRARHGIADPDPENEFAALADAAFAAGPNDAPAAPNAAPMANKEKMAEYLEAKRRAIRERKLLEQQEVAYAIQAMPTAVRAPTVKIWEKAEAASEPENRIAKLVESILH